MAAQHSITLTAEHTLCATVVIVDKQQSSLNRDLQVLHGLKQGLASCAWTRGVR